MASMRTIGVKLRLETGAYKQDAAQAAAATNGLKTSLADVGTRGRANLNDLATGMGLVGGALVAVAGTAIYAAATFDKQMSAVAAVTETTAGEMDALRQAAIDAGAATVFSATEAARAEEELAKAGISAADILGGALTGSLSLAAAGSLDLAEAATISASAMNTFGLSGGDVAHIADVLAAAANKSAADVHDLGLGLQQVGLVANQVGFSLEETVGLLAAFADRGLRGSDGATSLKTALQRLAAPTAKAAELMEDLGISMYDQNGQMVGAVEVAGQLQDALGDLTPAQRNAALQTLFGSDAIRAANVMYAEGAAGIQDYIDAVNDQGAAGDAAAEKLNNLAGDVERLKGSLESLAIEAGSGANGGLRLLVQGADELVGKFMELPSVVQTGLTVLAGVGGTALLAGAGLLKMRTTLHEALDAMRASGPAASRFATGLETTTKWATRASVALGALMIVDEIASSFRDAEVDTTALAESLDHLAKTGQANTEVLRLFGDDLKGFGEAVQATRGWGGDLLKGTEAIPVIGSIFAEGERMASDFNRSAGDSAIVLKAMDDQLAAMVRGGNVEQAIKLAHDFGEANHLMWDEVEAALPGFTAAMMNASSATKDQAGAAASATGPMKDLAGAMGDAAGEGQDLVEVWNELHGKTMSADEALLAARKTVDDVAESFKNNSGAIKGSSDAALENRIAMGRAGEAAADAAQKYFDLTGDLDGAIKIMNDQKVASEKAAIANGGNARSVHELADELFDLPSLTKAKVQVDGTKAGEALVNALQRTINSLKGKTVYVNTVTTNTTTNVLKTVKIASAQRWGGAYVHADVGLLRDASIHAPMAPARYAFAEPATGGEAFIPKRGDYGRSMSILSQAASWYGATVQPGGGRSGPVQTHRIVLEGTGMFAGFQREILVRGGDVQVSLGAPPRRP